MPFDPIGWLTSLFTPTPAPSAPPTPVPAGQQSISGLPYGVTNYTGQAIRPVLEAQLGANYDPWIDYALQNGLKSYVTVDSGTVTPEVWNALRQQSPGTWGQVAPLALGSQGGAGYALPDTGQVVVATGGPIGYAKTEAMHELMHIMDAAAERQGKGNAAQQKADIQNLYRQAGDTGSYALASPNEAFAWTGANRRTGFPYAPNPIAAMRATLSPTAARSQMDQFLDLIEGRFPAVPR